MDQISCEVALKAFLQFTTGSDVIAVTEITVSFNALDGAHCSPIARTCGPVLEVPTTYQSYNELAEEFSNLTSNKEAWGFTIVSAFHIHDDTIVDISGNC